VIGARNLVVNWSSPQRQNLSFAEIEINLKTRAVYRRGRRVHVGPTEFRLLCHLLQHPRRVFSRREIIHVVWPNNVFVEPRAVDAHIVRLRKALNEDGEPNRIRSAGSDANSLDTIDSKRPNHATTLSRTFRFALRSSCAAPTRSLTSSMLFASRNSIKSASARGNARGSI
jgi:hypothetical protein